MRCIRYALAWHLRMLDRPWYFIVSAALAAVVTATVAVALFTWTLRT